MVGVDATALGYVVEWLQARRALGIPDEAPLFCTVRSGKGGRARRMSSSSLRDQLKHYGRKAGIQKRVHPHGLRHTHAFELANESVPLHVIQAQLGHASLSMTAHYIDHLAPQQIVRAIAAREWPGGTAPPPATRAAASQGAPVALSDSRLIPAFTPVPREPTPAPLDKGPGGTTPRGVAKAKILEVLRSNGGRATQAQLERALGIKGTAMRRHCEELSAVGDLARLGECPRQNGGRPHVIWALPPLRAVYQLDPAVQSSVHARRGHGAARVLATIERLGGRASQSQVAGELGISCQTVGVHCKTLQAEGKLERGGRDKSRSNRGSHVWRLPNRARITGPPVTQLRIAGGSSTGGLR